MKKAIAVVLVTTLVLTLLLGLVGCTKTINIDPKHLSSIWMRKISDDTLLSSISIPGTHDSGAYKSGLIHNLGRDQELTITQQLEVGVRFLDIRLDAQKGGLTVYHGFLNEHLSFDDVLLDCFAFLDKNPTETIIICIKQERKNSITDKVHAYIEKDASKWFLENRVPTLGEVRGKLVLFRRFADNVDFGLNLYDGFPENTSGDFNNGVKCHVQDYYNYGSKKNMDAEWVAVEECLDYSKSSAENEYVINFTSGFYYVLGFIPQIKKTAQYVHPRFIAYATEHAADCYGIVLFDFVSENLAYAVYTTNQSVNLE